MLINVNRFYNVNYIGYIYIIIKKKNNMDFVANKEKPQKLKLLNQQSAFAIAMYLKDHTFISWQTMMKVWIGGYTYSINNVRFNAEADPRPNGGFWGGGGHAGSTNYVTTIQYLVDHGYCTFSRVSGFKLMTATKKLKSLDHVTLKGLIINNH